MSYRQIGSFLNSELTETILSKVMNYIRLLVGAPIALKFDKIRVFPMDDENVDIEYRAQIQTI